MDQRLTDMISLLGCPAAGFPDRELQIAELRQRHQFARLSEWRDGSAEVESSPYVPMLLLRYAQSVNVATFSEGSARPRLNVWARFFPAIFPFGDCGTLDLEENVKLRIGSSTYMACYALVDITEREKRPPFDSLAVYGTHILELARTVVAFGPPEQLRDTRLQWLSPPN